MPAPLAEESEEGGSYPRAPGSLAHLGDERTIGWMVFGIAWPAIVENSLHTLLGIVDTILVARLGNEAVAGVGSGVQYLFLAVSVLIGLSTGGVVLIARAFGAGDRAGAGRTAQQLILLGIVAGLILTVLGSLLAEPAIVLLGAEPAVVAIGSSYLRIISYSAIPLALSLLAGAALRAAGDTRTPMVVTGMANVVNAAVAYVLIFGHLGFPALGTDGSAWGMNAARALSASALLFVLFRGSRGLSVRGRIGWRPDLTVIRRILGFGLPTAIEQVLLMGSFMAFAAIALALGTLAFATQRITFNALTISFMPAFGFAIAATTLTGQALGAGRADLAERLAWTAVRMAALWMSTMGLVFFSAGEPLLRVFTEDPEVIAMGVPALRVIAAANPIFALGMVLAGSLRGAGDTRFPMLVSLIAGWGVRVPIAYLLGIHLGGGLTAVYVAVLFDAAVAAGLTLWRYRRGRWRSAKVSVSAAPALASS